MAIDLLNAIFGGSNQTSSSAPVNMTPAPDAALQAPLANTLQTLMTTGGPTYTGPLTTPATANENTLLQQLMTTDPTAPGSPTSTLLNNTLNGTYLTPQSNPFLQAAITAAQRPTLEGLDQTLTRDLPGRFTQAGQSVQPQGSSAFDTAAAIASRGTANALGDIATNMSYQNYNDERNRQQAAIPMSQQQVATTIQNLQAQALPRLIQENGIDRGLQLFQQQSQQLLSILGLTAQVAAPVVANSSTSTGDASKGIVPDLTSLFTPAAKNATVGGQT